MNDTLLNEKNFRQMLAALEEIRERAPTMPNGGAWAGGIAMLCLGTLTPAPSDERKVKRYFPIDRDMVVVEYTESASQVHPPGSQLSQLQARTPIQETMTRAEFERRFAHITTS